MYEQVVDLVRKAVQRLEEHGKLIGDVRTPLTLLPAPFPFVLALSIREKQRIYAKNWRDMLESELGPMILELFRQKEKEHWILVGSRLQGQHYTEYVFASHGPVARHYTIGAGQLRRKPGQLPDKEEEISIEEFFFKTERPTDVEGNLYFILIETARTILGERRRSPR